MDPRELEIEKRWLLNARTDPEAFMHFYAKYYDRVFRLCYHRVLDRELAEDLTAETFLQAQQNLGRFRWQGATMGAWLYRIALNQVRYRLRNLLPLNAFGPGDDRLEGEGADPLAAMLLEEACLRVRRAIARLDEDTREAVRLHYWDDLTTREIAVVLDEIEGTIKARLSRGRQRLRELLAAQDEGADAPRESRPAPRDGA
ncbi:MAG: RNA polymerase sigma factor [Candidatus Krumholzibacteriia bacterium]